MPETTACPPARSERSLIHAVSRGDEAAAGELFRLFGEPVLRFVYRRVREQMEDAEEITLDTFTSAIKLAPTYDGRAGALTWLCGIAKLRIVDFYRRDGRDKRIPSAAQAPLDESILSAGVEEVLDRIDAERLVDQLLSGLSDDEREAMMLRYGDQFSVREISVMMKRSEKGIEALLSRAKSKPRAMVERLRREGVQ